ncbi:cell wall synthesis protein CwsA [Mycolicibacterium goodii]|uniref:Cell wall synthesis protein CwsA n=1 Tax=Mycolicibacterium goodii TaxID=134601 RepID=A0A0K0X2J8_MYCGD|nr:cell wall synthesis protein CwsA [Mycolicibacterium goodii]
MSARADVRLAPRQRLTRGLKYTAVGPVDITRGVLGIGAHTAQATAIELHRRYESGKLQRRLAAAAEAVQESLAALPETIQEAVSPPKKKRRRPLLIAAVAVTVLAGGAAAFSIVRRRSRPQEPPTLAPSVEVAPKP